MNFYEYVFFVWNSTTGQLVVIAMVASELRQAIYSNIGTCSTDAPYTVKNLNRRECAMECLHLATCLDFNHDTNTNNCALFLHKPLFYGSASCAGFKASYYCSVIDDNLISVQPFCTTRSSSMVTLACPRTRSSLQITNRSFGMLHIVYGTNSPLIFASLVILQSPSLSPPITHGSWLSSPSSPSPLSSSLTRSIFYSELNTWLFAKSFPPQTLSSSTGLNPRTLGPFHVFILLNGLICVHDVLDKTGSQGRFSNALKINAVFYLSKNAAIFSRATYCSLVKRGISYECLSVRLSVAFVSHAWIV